MVLSGGGKELKCEIRVDGVRLEQKTNSSAKKKCWIN